VLLDWILRVLSLLPVLALTYDENYGYNEKPKEAKKSSLRFSIINLRLGKQTYYFLTVFCKDGKWKFKWKEKLSLDECQWMTEKAGVPLGEKDTYFEKLAEEYADEHLKVLQDNEKVVEKEFLEYLQGNLSYRKSLSYDKMNYYTTIILVFIPLAPTFFRSTFSQNIHSYLPLLITYAIAASLLVYALFNWVMLAIAYMSVTGIKKASFSEIKKPPDGRNKPTQQLYSYYHDWKEERFDTDLRVAYVKETELLVKCSAFLLFVVIVLAGAAYCLDMPTTNLTQDGTEIVYSFHIGELEDPFSADSLELSELHTEIRRNRPETLVVFISNETVSLDIVNENLRQYEEYVAINTYIDSELSAFEFKVALLEE